MNEITLDEYIKQLQALQAAGHGHLYVRKYDMMGGACAAHPPKLGFMRVLRKREFKPRFWSDTASDSPENKGEPVIKI